MLRSLRVLLPCLVFVCSLLSSGCGEDCDHPADPGDGSWSSDESYSIGDQSELEALAGVTSIGGDLYISAWCDTCVIDDLSPLSDLVSVRSLYITSTTLRDLHGLESLEICEQVLEISGNDSLRTTAGLAALSEVGRLELSRNPNLVALSDLERANPVAIAIFELDRVASLDVFADLSRLLTLHVDDCPALGELPRAATPELFGVSLRELPSLVELGLHGEATGLTNLDLDDLPAITSLAAITGYPELTYLGLRDLPGVTELPDLSTSTQLIDVGLRNLPGITSLSRLAGIPARYLSLGSMGALTDLQGLTSLPNLESLWVTACSSIASLDGVADVPNLRRVDCRDCPDLVEIGEPDFPAELREIWIQECGLTDLSGLDHLSGLQWLMLNACEDLESLAGAAAAPGLQRLQLIDLPALVSLGDGTPLPALETFDIQGCASLVGLDGLGAMAALHTLSVRECESLQGLAGLTLPASLIHLSINGNAAMQSLDGIAGLAAVYTLTIMGNRGFSDAVAFEFAQSLDITGWAQIGGNGS